MKLTAVAVITNNLVAARFWMALAVVFAGIAGVAPYLTILAMKAKEKVVILDAGGTLIYSPLLGFEEAGQLHAYHAVSRVSRCYSATRPVRICRT